MGFTNLNQIMKHIVKRGSFADLPLKVTLIGLPVSRMMTMKKEVKHDKRKLQNRARTGTKRASL